MIVGDLERQREDALLDVVQIEQTAKQKRTHVRDRGPHRVTALAQDIPEDNRAALPHGRLECERTEALLQLRRQRARNSDPRDVAFDVGHERRDANPGERLRDHLHGDGLARTCCAGDEAMTIGQRRQEREALAVSGVSDDERCGHQTQHTWSATLNPASVAVTLIWEQHPDADRWQEPVHADLSVTFDRPSVGGPILDS